MLTATEPNKFRLTANQLQRETLIQIGLAAKLIRLICQEKLMGRAARLRSKRRAEKLRQIRIALGLSQNELIRRMGLKDIIYQSNMSGYELGEREPPLPILLKYAHIAGISTDYLIDDNLELPEKSQSRFKIKVSTSTPTKRHKK
jgi:DNA-binding XRE family transcriptional regulator